MLNMNSKELKNTKKGKLLVFSAPSGSGKTTIVRHLLALDYLNLEFSISATSRPSRGEEVDGKDYYFLSIKESVMGFKNSTGCVLIGQTAEKRTSFSSNIGLKIVGI